MNQGPSRALALFIARRPGRLILFVVLLAVLAVWPLARLHFESNLEQILPEDLPAARDYRQFLDTFGGFEKVFVLITSDQAIEPDPDQLIRAADVLARALRERPSVSSARSGLDHTDEEFFLRFALPRAPLIADVAELETVASLLDPASLRLRVGEIRQLISGPAGFLGRRIVTHDPLGIGQRLIFSGRGLEGLPLDPFTLTFLSEDEDSSLVLVTPAQAEFDPEGGRALLSDLQSAFDETRAAVDIPLEFLAIGGPLYAVYDERALRGDLERTALGTAVAVAIILFLAFGNLSVPLATLLSVTIGLVWTGALVAVTLGSLTALGVGLTSILVGLGVDYGIHGASRFRHLYSKGHDPSDALTRTFQSVGPGILASVATTAAAFWVLALAHFRPLREMGFVVATGIIAILAASMLGGAALLIALARRSKPRGPNAAWRIIGHAVGAIVQFSARRRRVVLVVAGALTAASAWGALGLSFDSSPRNLRPVEHPAYAAEARLAEEFNLTFDSMTVVVQAEDLDHALASAHEVASRMRDSLGPHAVVNSPSDWLIDRERLEHRLTALSRWDLNRVVADFERELASAGFSIPAFSPGLDALRAIAAGKDPGAPARNELPAWLAALIREGPDGAAVAVQARLPQGLWPQGPPDTLIHAVREIAPDSYIASVSRLGNELRTAALGDMSRLGIVALVVVALVVIASFRGDLRRATLACLPVFLGSIWVFGLWGALGRPLDLFCLAAMPIMLGIGIDDGLHAVHGSRREAGNDVTRGVITAGHAIVLTSLTTGVGFASLTLSHVPALQNGGLLVAAGVFGCLVATLTVLPALSVTAPPERTR